MSAEIYPSPIGRVSWAFVFGAGDDGENGAAKYKLTLMLPKHKDAIKHLGLNPAKVKALLREVDEFVELIREQAEESAKGRFKTKYTTSRFDPVIDGDEKADSFAGNANFWLLRMKTKFKPKVSAPKKSDGYITDGNDDEKDGFYSGCWARVQTSLYTYDTDGNRGVAVGLGHIQKAWNDEPFATGGAEFEGDVEDLDIDESDFGNQDDADFDDLK